VDAEIPFRLVALSPLVAVVDAAVGRSTTGTMRAAGLSPGGWPGAGLVAGLATAPDELVPRSAYARSNTWRTNVSRLVSVPAEGAGVGVAPWAAQEAANATIRSKAEVVFTANWISVSCRVRLQERVYSFDPLAEPKSSDAGQASCQTRKSFHCR
jgi:hypothetical protein